jgi:hypothetical protein
MSTKTKTTAAAAMAALALPAAALAHDGEKGRGHDKDRHEQRDDSRGKHKQHSRHEGRRAFVLAGVDATGLTITDGRLAGELTVDPIGANRGARKLLDLTKDEIRGEDTVKFGTAGDAVRVKYKGLPEGEAPKPTDVVTVFGKIDRRSKALDIKKIWIKRPGAAQTEARKTEGEKSEQEKSERESRKG